MKLCYSAPKEVYSAPKDIPGGSVNDVVSLVGSDETVIYDIYDELASEHPEYVSKKKVGQVFSRSFNRYRFAYPANKATLKGEKKPFKVCIVTSLHGYEQGSAWTTAQFFRLLCTDKEDPHLSFLRSNTVFEVIPVANPWGFSHNKRKNGNGVDLNRNFKPYFVEGQKPDAWGYGGSHPCSELETRWLMEFIDENSDADLVLDYHNIDKGYPLFYVYGERDVRVAQEVFGALTKKWISEYSAFPKDTMLGGTKSNGRKGMFCDYIISKGLWVLTMETPWCMPEVGGGQYDAPTIRCALDILVNTLLIVQNNCYCCSK